MRQQHHEGPKDENGDLDSLFLRQSYRNSPLLTNMNSGEESSEHRISLRSLDDDEVRQFLRSLITPIPTARSPSAESDLQRQRRNCFSDFSVSDTHSERDDIGRDRETPSPWLLKGENRSESVMLFKKLMTGEEDVPLNFATSDIRDFVDPAMLEDIISRPGSRLPHTTEPIQHKQHGRDDRTSIQSIEASSGRRNAQSPLPVSPISPTNASASSINEARRASERHLKESKGSDHVVPGNNSVSSRKGQNARRSSESSVMHNAHHSRHENQGSGERNIKDDNHRMDQILSRSMQKTKMLLDIMERSMLEESIMDTNHRKLPTNTFEPIAERPRRFQKIHSSLKSDEIKRHSVDMDAILALRRDTDALLERRLSVLKNRASCLLDSERHDPEKCEPIDKDTQDISLAARRRRKTIHTNSNVSTDHKHEDPPLITNALKPTKPEAVYEDDNESNFPSKHHGHMDFTTERQRTISVPASRDESRYSTFYSKRNRTASLPGGSSWMRERKESCDRDLAYQNDTIEDEFKEIDELSSMNLQSKTSQRILMNHLRKHREEHRSIQHSPKDRRSSKIIDLRNRSTKDKSFHSKESDDLAAASGAEDSLTSSSWRLSNRVGAAKAEGRDKLTRYGNLASAASHSDQHRQETGSNGSELPRSNRRSFLHYREEVARETFDNQSKIPNIRHESMSNPTRKQLNPPARRAQFSERMPHNEEVKKTTVRKARDSTNLQHQDPEESVTEAAMALLNSIRDRRRNTVTSSQI